MRGDERAIPQLLAELDSRDEPDDLSTVEEALLALAARTGDVRLYEHVAAARQQWTETCAGELMPDDLGAAVEACERAVQT